MTSITMRLSILTILFVGMSSAGEAEPAPLSKVELVTKVKPACVYIETNSGSGSGFCIDRTGLFVTNFHVIKDVPRGAEVTVVVDSSLPSQRLLKGKLLRSDAGLDLALIQSTTAANCPIIPLGTVDKLSELVEVIAFGFPFGKALSEGQSNPAISVNKSNVSALRRDAKGKLEFIQMDSNLNPGNSGGPVVDQNGQVVGIVLAGIPGAGINMAIPVSRLSDFLSTPVIALAVPAITAGNVNDSQEFSATVVGDPRTKSQVYDVELQLATPGTSERKLPMRLVNGAYTVKAPPLEPVKGTVGMSLTAEFSTGSVTVKVQEREISIGGKSMKLSQLESFSPSKGEAHTRDGQDIQGKVSGLDQLLAKIGSLSVALPFSEASSIEVTPGQPPPMTFTVIVRLSGREIGRQEQVVELGDPATVGGVAIKTTAVGLEALIEGVFKKPKKAAARQTYLNVLSTSGDYIGQGKRYNYTKDQLQYNGSEGLISVNVDNWRLTIAPGKGRIFKLGEYDQARRYPFNDTMPGIDFSGNGRGSNQLAGKFVIWEFRLKGDQIQELAVDFIQRSEMTGPPLVGMLRINSTLE